MIPLAVPHLSGNEARYLQECIDSQFVSSVGPFVTRFETMVAAAAGCRYGVATSAGTTGLHAALVAVGVERDDLVILPSFTFIASANAISHCGAQPWLFDIDEGWTLDPILLEEKLARECRITPKGLIHQATGRRVAAMMPVHTLGLPADMDRLIPLARHYGLPVVADAACALGATDKGRAVGALGADLNVFSFNGNKTVTAGGGGVVAGDDEALLARVRHLTTTARLGEDYNHDVVGFNYRMTNLQAAVGVAQMERLDEFVAAKRRIARRYEESLSDLPGVGLFGRRGGAESACWFSGVHVTAPAPSIQTIIARLKDAGIGARSFWKAMHHQKPYANAPRTDMARTDALEPGLLTLPCSTSLPPEDQEKVITALRACWEKTSS